MMSRLRIQNILIAGALLLSTCSHELKKGPPPTVGNADLTYCNANQTFVVTGTGLSPLVNKGATSNPELEMPKVCLQRIADIDNNPVSDQPQKCLKNEDVEWVSQNEIRFLLNPEYGLEPGHYTVSVTNPDGQDATGMVRLRVLPGEMFVFWSDPSIVWNGSSIQATVYGTNITDVMKVTIRDASFNETTVESQQTGTRANRVLYTIPQGVAPGEYDVVVTTSTGCQAELKGGLTVTATRDDTLVASVDPTFGSTNEETPITITGTGFQPVPRVYLNPHTPGAGSIATALESVAMKDANTVTAVVPKGLTAAAYDVIVVNPDGKVAVLDKLPGATAAAGGFFINSAAPPVVNNVSPLYVTNQAPVNVTVDGSGFNNPAVTLTCRKPDNTEQELTGTTTAGGGAMSFEVTLPVTGLPAGTVCLMTVTNPDNSYYVFSAIGISLPSANLNPMIAAPEMGTARRAPAVAAGRATRSARFIYAIGGDDGTTANAMTSVETTAIDVYGVPSAWFDQPVELPAKRTLAGVTRVGRFLYLVGGNDGTGPTNGVLRAEVLQPSNAPEVVDVGARRTKQANEGIGAGIWYYRVSAVMADTDASNPGGETLASDPVAINLSEETLAGLKVALTLYWTQIPGAKAYRIYRSPNGNENLEGVRMLTEVAGGMTTFYEDVAPAGGATGGLPRPLGATGNWAKLPNLLEAREAAGVASAQDPSDPNKWYVYAVGGRGAAPLASVERMDIAIDPVSGAHTLASAWVAVSNISAARSELTAYSVSHAEARQVPKGTTYIYAAGGAGSTNVDIGMVGAGGGITFSTGRSQSPPRQGYAGVAGAGFLFAFGGANTGGTDDSMAAAQINPTSAPDLVNWNNNGGARLTAPRYYGGGVVESAFIYLVGGMTRGMPTKSAERTVL
jgi:hypothetical protein